MNDDLAQRLLDHINHENYQPVKPRVIARQLKLDKDQEKELKRVIKRLTKKGDLAYGSKHLVKRAEPGSQQPMMVGTFRRTSKGYGFVRPKDATAGDRSTDVFIPNQKSLDAATGDIVAVQLGRRERGKLSGRIVEVVERQTSQFVGTWVEEPGFVGVQIDGNVFSHPIEVADTGSHPCQAGDKVVIEMLRFPTHAWMGEGVVIELLGKSGEPGVDTLSVMREFNLPQDFPEEVLDDARDQVGKFDESIGDRLDLTEATIVTIDPADARDFDDAISLERTPEGHWRLGVHIADVTHFVPRRSKLDQEARERATSVYLPDRVIPMLPELVSNGLASLQPHKIRYARTVFIEFTPDGARVDAEVYKSAIRSQHRFTYEDVDSYLDGPSAWTKKLTEPVHALVGRMHELAMILRGRRMADGALELTLPEVKIDLSKSGQVKGAHVVENTVSHQIIEEFMLAANEAVADLLSRHGIQFLRRIHDPPDPRKLHSLTSFVRELGISCDSLESRFEIQRVVAQVAGKPEQYAVNYAVLRSMSKAVYSPRVERHYALNSENYCHFTSPIRRYPDLTVHRILDDLDAGHAPDSDTGRLMILGEHCSDREQRAEAAERELVKVKLLHLLKKKIGLQLDAVITGVERYGLYARGVDLPAEGLIHIQALQDDYYRYDKKSHMLTGNRAGNRFRLGDLIQVEVAQVDVERRELDFRIVTRRKKKRPD